MLYEKLTEKDYNLIESYLDAYDRNPNSEIFKSRASLDTILSQWATAKSEYLYQLLENNFILEREIEYTDSPENLATKIEDSYHHRRGTPAMRDFYIKYREWMDTLSLNYWSNEHAVLHRLVWGRCLCRATVGEFVDIKYFLPITIDFGDGKKIKIEATSKPIRILSKLVKMFGFVSDEVFENFRLEHSRMLNTKKIKGTLCLSIHPLDYMTMSMNAENWTSCMNWREPGGYRGGTVEVMNSSMTIVAYLKSDSNVLNWYNGTWNSKKWRLLITITPDSIITIKSYPYHHEALAQTCVEWLRHLAGKNMHWYMGSVVQVPCCTTFEYADTKTWRNIDLIDGGLMYNDWGCDTHYGCFTLNPTFFETSDTNPELIRLDYCGPMTCMCCGKVDNSGHFYDESYVICDRCCSYGDEERGNYCSHCGCWIPEDEGYWIEDDCYCCDCIEEVASRCAIEYNYFYHDDIGEVLLAREADNPDVDNDRIMTLYIGYCKGRYEIPDIWSHCEHPHKTEDGIWYLNREDLTEEGFRRLYGLRPQDVEQYFNRSE